LITGDRQSLPFLFWFGAYTADGCRFAWRVANRLIQSVLLNLLLYKASSIPYIKTLADLRAATLLGVFNYSDQSILQTIGG